MGTMSASDAAPLPRLGEVFFDVRGDSRTMRVSWYADTGVAVFSMWQGDTCTGTFRLPIPELPRMVEALSEGPPGAAGPGQRAAGPGHRIPDPGPPTAAMGPAAAPAPAAEPPVQGWSYGEPRERYEQAPGGYAAAEGEYDDHPGYGQPGYDSPGYDSPGYDSPGYDSPGYDPPGYDPRGYESPGYESPEPPAAPARARLFRRREPSRPPTGPLHVGRWHSDEPGGEYPAAQPEPWAGPPDGGYHDDRGYHDEAGYQDDGEPLDAGYHGDGGYGVGADPLDVGYQGEAEQGYLPGPPTDTFPAAPPAGGYGGEASYRGGGAHRSGYEHGGYESDPAGRDHASPYPAHGDHDDPPEPGYRPDAGGGSRQREYGHSRGRS
jgi:hypothetical protein